VVACRPLPSPHPARLAAGLAAFALGATALASPAAVAAPRAATAPATAPAPAGFEQRADVRAWAEAAATRHGVEAAWLLEQVARAVRLEAPRRLVMPPPGTAKNWAAYRARFVEPRRIDAGLAFWNAHAERLEAAEARFGVPPEIVVGVIGVETFYGRILGSFRVLDAIATLAFDFPPGRRDRSAYFQEELGHWLARARREGFDPTVPRGSFAGASGLPQFMPGSLERHAIDFDGDGRTDLTGSAADAIGSVAKYLADFGWRRGMPTHFAVAAPVDVADRAALLAPDILPTFSAAQFAERGAALESAGVKHEGPLALVELQNGAAAPSFVAGTANFYAVTRYNWSSYYAMAVIDLGAAVKERRLDLAARPGGAR
jgi:membrane-bound lytic murein transglycosylase B